MGRYTVGRAGGKFVTIVHVTPSLDPAAGGLPVVPVRLAAAQAALGHAVTILAQHDSAARSDPPALFAGVPGIERVRYGWLPPAGPAAMVRSTRTTAALDVPLANATIVHLHGIWAPVMAAAARAAQRRGVPYIVAPHGMLDPWSLSQKRWKKRLALALTWRRILNAAAAIHCLNADEQRLLADLRLTAPTTVIPNGIFLHEVQPAPEPLSARFPTLAGRRFILFLSRLHYKKGLDILADAFAMIAPTCRDVHLVVAGPDEGARGEFERRIQAAGLEPRTHLLGALLGPDKWAALRDAAVFCLPSRQEGFSMAVLEALASRTPVVISDACHFPEVAASGAGIVTSLEPQPIAAALERILSNPTEARRMGTAGRQLVETRFTWERAAATALAAYDRVRPH